MQKRLDNYSQGAVESVQSDVDELYEQVEVLAKALVAILSPGNDTTRAISERIEAIEEAIL